ncbi:MAG: 30S ribosomal protein S2 [Amoebophilaceae bacterium]|jgi:small subunit ribosomal protein S2|nr:30S ribosomal protein S2 [Amoebophilaceae bacterium]
MITLQHKDLLNAGVHFGHLTSKWHPNMAPFIFMERNGIHIIDLNKTLLQLQEATHALKAVASAGKRILFVATKKQAKGVVEQEARRLGMPYVTERWLGGTLTNFATIRKLLKKMSSFDKLMKDTAYQNMAKKEQLMIAREKGKLERLLQGIADTTRLPAALFVVDIKKEHIAVKEAQRLGIPVFAITDTNTNPEWVDYPIPSNDDASRSIELIIKTVGSAIEEGLEERQRIKEVDTLEQIAASRGSRERNVEKVISSETAVQKTRTVSNAAKPASRVTKKAETQQATGVGRLVHAKEEPQPNKETTTA